MTKPHIMLFNHPEVGEFATVVIDKDDFDDLCDELCGVFMINMGERVADTQIESIKAAGCIPMIGRGTKTAFLFERFDVEQDHMSVIMRGKGREIAHDVKMRRIQAN